MLTQIAFLELSQPTYMIILNFRHVVFKKLLNYGMTELTVSKMIKNMEECRHGPLDYQMADILSTLF